MGAWDESAVEEFKDVKTRYHEKNLDFHVARIFDLCVEKGSGLPTGHPDRTWKGRVILAEMACGRNIETLLYSRTWLRNPLRWKLAAHHLRTERWQESHRAG